MRRRLMGGSSAITATLVSQPDTVAGDVCFYDSATDSKVFYRLDEGTDIIPETCTPIGVTVIPASHNVYGTGECAIASLKCMSKHTPETGGPFNRVGSDRIPWEYRRYFTTAGKGDFIVSDNLSPETLTVFTFVESSGDNYVSPVYDTGEIPCIHDTSSFYKTSLYGYLQSPYIQDGLRNPNYSSTTLSNNNILNKFNGKELNSKVIGYLSDSEKTVNSVIMCCNKYHTNGTNLGDWYLPSVAEAGYLIARSNKIYNIVETIFNKYNIEDNGFFKDGTFTCTPTINEFDKNNIYHYSGNCIVDGFKGNSYNPFHAFLRVPPPPTPAGITVTFDDNDSGALLTSDGGDNSWIKGRRCLAKPQSDGSVSICYLDENNSELYHDGTTAADLSGAQGQWMTDIPEYWFHMDESTEGIHKLSISPTEVEEWKHSRRVLVGVTEAVNVDGKLWSRKVSGGELSTGNLTSIKYHGCANAIGDGWDIIDYETHCKIGHLFYAKYLNKDCQTVIGTGENSYTRTIGTTSSLGNNDGTTDTQISFLGVEDAWGGKYEWMGGIHRNNGTVYIYDGFQPDSVPTVGYRTETISYGGSYYNSCITKMQWGDNADMLPIAYVSDSNYSQCYFDHCDVGGTGYRTARRSSHSAILSGGVAHLGFAHSSSSVGASYGSRIQYRGTINIVDDITTFESLSIA